MNSPESVKPVITYADQIDAWSSGGTFPWPFTDAALTAARRDELILTPVG